MANEQPIENIIKAKQCSELLESDLRAIYRDAIDRNDALVILTEQLLQQVVKVTQVLAQLEGGKV